jgi:hypothetical protein
MPGPFDSLLALMPGARRRIPGLDPVQDFIEEQKHLELQRRGWERDPNAALEDPWGLPSGVSKAPKPSIVDPLVRDRNAVVDPTRMAELTLEEPDAPGPLAGLADSAVGKMLPDSMAAWLRTATPRKVIDQTIGRTAEPVFSRLAPALDWATSTESIPGVSEAIKGWRAFGSPAGGLSVMRDELREAGVDPSDYPFLDDLGEAAEGVKPGTPGEKARSMVGQAGEFVASQATPLNLAFMASAPFLAAGAPAAGAANLARVPLAGLLPGKVASPALQALLRVGYPLANTASTLAGLGFMAEGSRSLGETLHEEFQPGVGGITDPVTIARLLAAGGEMAMGMEPIVQKMPYFPGRRGPKPEVRVPGSKAHEFENFEATWKPGESVLEGEIAAPRQLGEPNPLLLPPRGTGGIEMAGPAEPKGPGPTIPELRDRFIQAVLNGDNEVADAIIEQIRRQGGDPTVGPAALPAGGPEPIIPPAPPAPAAAPGRLGDSIPELRDRFIQATMAGDTEVADAIADVIRSRGGDPAVQRPALPEPPPAVEGPAPAPPRAPIIPPRPLADYSPEERADAFINAVRNGDWETAMRLSAGGDEAAVAAPAGTPGGPAFNEAAERAKLQKQGFPATLIETIIQNAKLAEIAPRGVEGPGEVIMPQPIEPLEQRLAKREALRKKLEDTRRQVQQDELSRTIQFPDEEPPASPMPEPGPPKGPAPEGPVALGTNPFLDNVVDLGDLGIDLGPEQAEVRQVADRYEKVMREVTGKQPPAKPPAAPPAAVAAPEPPLQPQGPSPRGFGVDRAVETRMPVDQLQTDPQRFQYKLGVTKEGVRPEDVIQGEWNPNRAGVLLVWRDPANGQVYVVNGHHRLQAAKARGVKDLLVRFIDAPTAEQARLEGAFTNIAENRGNAIDAAKILKQTGMSPEQLRDAGVNFGTDVGRQGTALANLSEPTLTAVATGEMSLARGVAIGKAGLTPAQESAVLKVVGKLESGKKSKRLGEAVVHEIALEAKHSPDIDVKEGTQGAFEEFLKDGAKLNLLAEKARLRASVRDRLAKDRKLFGFVTRGSRATELGRAGETKIDVEAATGIAQQAAKVEGTFDALAEMKGPVNDVINAAAVRLARGDAFASVAESLYDDVRFHVERELRYPTLSEVERALRPRQPESVPDGGAATEGGTPPAEVVNFEDFVRERKEVPAGTQTEPAEPTRADLEDAGQGSMFGEEVPADRPKATALEQEQALAALTPDELQRALDEAFNARGPQPFADPEHESWYRALVAEIVRRDVMGEAAAGGEGPLSARAKEWQQEQPARTIAGPKEREPMPPEPAVPDDLAVIPPGGSLMRKLGGGKLPAEPRAPEPDALDEVVSPAPPADRLPTTREIGDLSTRKLGKLLERDDLPESLRDAIEGELEDRGLVRAEEPATAPEPPAEEPTGKDLAAPPDLFGAEADLPVYERTTAFGDVERSLPGVKFPRVAGETQVFTDEQLLAATEKEIDRLKERRWETAGEDQTGLDAKIADLEESRREIRDRIEGARNRGFSFDEPAPPARDRRPLSEQLQELQARDAAPAAEPEPAREPLPPNVRSLLKRQVGLSDAEIDELSPAEAKATIDDWKANRETKLASQPEPEPPASAGDELLDLLAGRFEAEAPAREARIADIRQNLVGRQLERAVPKSTVGTIKETEVRGRLEPEMPREGWLDKGYEPPAGVDAAMEEVKTDELEALLEGESEQRGLQRRGILERRAERIKAGEDKLTEQERAALGEAEGETWFGAEPPPTPEPPEVEAEGMSPTEALNFYKSEAKWRAKLLDNPTEPNLRAYFKRLGQALDRLFERQAKGGHDRPPTEVPELGEYLHAGFAPLNVLMDDPKLFLRTIGAIAKSPMLRGLVGGLVGRQVEDDPWEGFVDGFLLAAAGPTAARALAKGAVRVARGQHWREPVSRDVSMWRAYFAPSAERSIPEVFSGVRALETEMEQAFGRTTSEVARTRIRKFYKQDFLDVFDEAATEADGLNMPRKAALIRAYRDAYFGKETPGQRIVRNYGTKLVQKAKRATGQEVTGEERLPGTFIEHKVQRTTYRAMLGFALDSAFKNYFQPVMALAYMKPSSLRAAWKLARTAEGRSLAGKVNLERLIDMPAEDVTNILTGRPRTEAPKPWYRDPDAPMRLTDNLNRRRVYLGMLKEQGWLERALAGEEIPAAIEERALSVMRKTQGHPGAMGSNPYMRGPVGGSVKPFQKFPGLMLETVIDVFNDPQTAPYRKYVLALAGLTMTANLSGIDFEDLFVGGRPLGIDVSSPAAFARSVKPGRLVGQLPVVRFLKDAVGHLDEFFGGPPMGHSVVTMPGFGYLDSDASLLFPGRYPTKFIKRTSSLLEEGLGGHRATVGSTRPTHTGLDDLESLVGLKSTDAGDRNQARDEAAAWMARDSRARTARLRDAYSELEQALRDNDPAAVADAQSRLTPEQRRRFMKRYRQTPYQRLLERVPKDRRREFNERFGAALREE